MKRKINVKKKKKVTGPWKSTNMCCVYRLQTMIWKYAKLSYHLPLIDHVILEYGVGKCICMCLIDDLKSW